MAGQGRCWPCPSSSPMAKGQRPIFRKRGFKHWYTQGKIVIEPGPPHLGDCWIFIGALTKDGYGQISYKSGERWRHSTAHRFFFELYRRPLLPHEEAAHRCHRRLCVRPKHLAAQTRRENRTDRFTIPVWSSDETRQIEELLTEGLPHSQIADLMRCPRAAIHRFARDYRQLSLSFFNPPPPHPSGEDCPPREGEEEPW